MFRLHAAWGEEVVLDLVTKTSKPALVPRGQSAFSAGASRNPIYWYSLTRMIAEGTVQIAGTQYDVDGLAWLDRIWRIAPFSQVSSSLGNRELGAFITAGQIAFNRFALQLNDCRAQKPHPAHTTDTKSVDSLYIDNNG